VHGTDVAIGKSLGVKARGLSSASSYHRQIVFFFIVTFVSFHRGRSKNVRLSEPVAREVPGGATSRRRKCFSSSSDHSSGEFAGVAHFHLTGLAESELDELVTLRSEIRPFIESARKNAKSGGIHRSPNVGALAKVPLRSKALWSTAS